MMKLRIHVVLLLLGWIGCMSLMYASDPIVRSFSVMERNHIRVKTPELFANGNSFEIHLENLSDSMWCFPLPKGKVISAYGARGGHSGSDIKTCANDTIRCVFDGVVRMAKHYGGYGKVIVVRHDNGIETIYSHNSKNMVAAGDTVKAGQPIALTCVTLHQHIGCKNRTVLDNTITRYLRAISDNTMISNFNIM